LPLSTNISSFAYKRHRGFATVHKHKLFRTQQGHKLFHCSHT
jgi:hypothetical protein